MKKSKSLDNGLLLGIIIQRDDIDNKSIDVFWCVFHRGRFYKKKPDNIVLFS
jgi:hypothetical protein